MPATPANDFTFAADLSERPAMLEAARSLLGSPYRFKGEGDAFDGWSFLRECAARATGRADLMDVARTSSGWDAVAGHTAEVAFVQWGMKAIKPGQAQPGDVLVYSTGSGVHAAIKSDRTHGPDDLTIIHAYPARHVTESWACPCGWADKPVLSAWTFDRPAKPRAAINPVFQQIFDDFGMGLAA